jgi:hypothetical protein
MFGILLMVGGLCGAAMSAVCSIVVSSSLLLFDGLELSLSLAVFSIVAFLSGLYQLFLTN